MWGGETVIRNCESKNNSHVGIVARQFSKLTAEGNLCTGNSQGGIRFQANSTGSATKNRCIDNQDGIEVTDEADARVEGNTCLKNKNHGILCTSKVKTVIRSNQCVGNMGSGIAVLDNASPEIHDNVCQNNLGYGIYVGGLATPVIGEKNILLPNRLGTIYRR